MMHIVPLQVRSRQTTQTYSKASEQAFECVQRSRALTYVPLDGHSPHSQRCRGGRRAQPLNSGRLHGSSRPSLCDGLYQQLTRHAPATFTFAVVYLGQSAFRCAFRCVCYRFRIPVCFSEGCLSLSCAAVYLVRTDLTVRSSTCT